jgi:hypothetical protein
MMENSNPENASSPLPLMISPAIETNRADVVQEHLQADEIRRQVRPSRSHFSVWLTKEKVEYYFSDENLATDSHLLALCGGSQNEPVSLNQILGWKKMRQYKRKSQVIAALEKSTMLEVLQNENGKKMIRRRVPFVEKPPPEPIDTDPTAVFTLPSRKRPKEEDDKAENSTESKLPLGYARDEHGLVKLASLVKRESQTEI